MSKDIGKFTDFELFAMLRSMRLVAYHLTEAQRWFDNVGYEAHSDADPEIEELTELREDVQEGIQELEQELEGRTT